VRSQREREEAQRLTGVGRLSRSLVCVIAEEKERRKERGGERREDEEISSASSARRARAPDLIGPNCLPQSTCFALLSRGHPRPE